jgi:hypothetical protein
MHTDEYRDRLKINIVKSPAETGKRVAFRKKYMPGQPENTGKIMKLAEKKSLMERGYESSGLKKLAGKFFRN